jgi:hypothetical protein
VTTTAIIGTFPWVFSIGGLFPLTDQLVSLFAKRFIQRRDVKAVQFSTGAFIPDRELRDVGRHAPLGFKKQHIEAHLAGTSTYGHYLLDSDSNARVFAFDIDLEKNKCDKDGNILEYGGAWCKLPDPASVDPNISNEEFDKLVAAHQCDPRELWQDRRAIEARSWFKFQMGMLARKFAKIIHDDLGLECAAAYSGNKGIHVYGFTGPMPAVEVRNAAMLVLDIMDEWKPLKGQHFFKHKIESPYLGYPSFSVETFPKQESLDGKDLGNLLRLPLGRNLKTSDPTFFLDLTTPPAIMKPHSDPAKLLETGNPWL